MTYALNFTANFGPAQTGLTLNAKLFDDSGVQAGATIASGIVEIGNGIYSYRHGSIPDGHQGTLIMYDSADVSVVVSFEVEQPALSPTERDNIADAVLKRDWASVTGEAARSVLNALRSLRNKVIVSGATLTVYKEDDVTPAWAATVATDAAAEPITGVTP